MADFRLCGEELCELLPFGLSHVALLVSGEVKASDRLEPPYVQPRVCSITLTTAPAMETRHIRRFLIALHAGVDKSVMATLEADHVTVFSKWESRTGNLARLKRTMSLD